MNSIKSLIKSCTILAKFIYGLRRSYYKLKNSDPFNRKMRIQSLGYIDIKKSIVGGGNKLIVGNKSQLDGVRIIVRGSNNIIEFGNTCYMGPNSKILLEGNNLRVIVKNGTRLTHDDELCCQEDNSSIEIGEGCLFSHHIVVRTSDSHSIIDVNSGARINPAKNVIIGSNVWVAPNAIIMKGVTVGNGSIIGTNSIVTKDVPSCCLAVGMPAKVVKTNVTKSNIEVC